MITVYTKDNCPACVSLKDELKRAKEPFVEVNIGKDISREDFLEQFPQVRSVPHVVFSKRPA